MSGTWRLLLKASHVQIGRSQLGMPLSMSKDRFFRVSISFLKPKIIDGIWRPLEVGPGVQQDTDRQVTLQYAFMHALIRVWWSVDFIFHIKNNS